MKRVEKYIEEFIINDIDNRGVLFLSKDYLFPREKLDELKKICSDFSLNKKIYNIANQEDINSNKDNHFKEIILDLDEKILVINEYQKFLSDKKYDGRNFRKVQELISEQIVKSHNHIKSHNKKYIFIESKIHLFVVDSIEQYIRFIDLQINSNSNINKELLFYRGHANINWDLTPSIFRDLNLIDNEQNMFRDILLRNPNKFTDTKSTFEKLTIMQHYGLPTRLLDITKSPLVALFFACYNNHNKENPGEIIVFKPNEDFVKYYDSDTVSVLSNLSKVDRNFEIDYNFKEFNDSESAGKLLHLIRDEKPYFSGIINPSDLNKALVVKPINNNERIKRQMGYFILFGMDAAISYPPNIDNLTFHDDKKVIVLIDEISKSKILVDLNILGINNDTLFPEIENGTDFIRKKYLNT